MLENQFIQFTDIIDPLKLEIAMQTRPNEEMHILVQATDVTSVAIAIVTPDGNRNVGQAIVGAIASVGEYYQYSIKYSGLAPKELYRIKLDADSKTMYSNILMNDPDANISLIKYLCKEPAFGFQFGKDSVIDEYMYIQQALPIRIYAPQYKQEDKVYTKLNGEQVVLFASITKEYEGETDYIPMEWHEKMLMALSCDEVYINGERVTKSGNYEIDHDNCTYTDCGIKLLRATFKVTTNVTQRNSNY